MYKWAICVKNVMRYALANKSLFAYIQQDATVLSKGPFRVVGRRYKKKITYANAYATFFKLFSFCTQNAMIFRSKSKTRICNPYKKASLSVGFVSPTTFPFRSQKSIGFSILSKNGHAGDRKKFPLLNNRKHRNRRVFYT